jgi:hypothetical protein
LGQNCLPVAFGNCSPELERKKQQELPLTFGLLFAICTQPAYANKTAHFSKAAPTF